MPSGQCWNTTQSLNPLHQEQLKSQYPEGAELFLLHTADIKQKGNESWTDYMNNLMENMPDGLKRWENGDWLGNLDAKFKDNLTMCKAINAIPMICFGDSGSPNDPPFWLGRNPINHLEFIEQFAKYFAFYLRNKWGFKQAILVLINEPKKIISTEQYIKICKALTKGFRQYVNFTVVIGNNDIEQDLDGYVQAVVGDKELVGLLKGCWYGTHVLWGKQHNQGYIKKVNELLSGSGIKQAVTEFSPNGDWGKYGVDNDWGAFNELRDNGIELYNILFTVRRDFFGDVFDEIRVFTREGRPDLDIKPGGWLPNGYSQKKHLALKKFNDTYYNKQLPLESEDMQFDNLYYRGRADTKYIYDPKKIAVRWLRLTFGLSDSAIFDSALENAVTAFQITKGLTADGKVGDNTIDALMLTEEGQKWFSYIQNRAARRKY